MKFPEYLGSWSDDSEIISFYILEVYWGWRDVGKMLRVLGKMTDFWKIVLEFIQC